MFELPFLGKRMGPFTPLILLEAVSKFFDDSILVILAKSFYCNCLMALVSSSTASGTQNEPGMKSHPKFKNITNIIIHRSTQVNTN
jgi:hypothetical protein